MRMRQLVAPAAAMLAVAGAAGCGAEGSSQDREERSTQPINECRGHGGVRAFDDDIVICNDQTFQRVEGG